MPHLHGCHCKEGTWEARIDFMPPNKPTLHVQGTCACPTLGFRVSLHRAVPQGVNPQILILRLEIVTATGEAGQAITDYSVTYSEQGARYSQVTIEQCDITIPVRSVS